MSVEKDKLEDIRHQVRECDELKPAHKDSLDDMLRLTAEATNGAQDRLQAIAVGLAALAGVIARDAMYRNSDIAELMDDALEKHRKDCPLANQPLPLKGQVTIQGAGIRFGGGQAVTMVAFCSSAIMAICWAAVKLHGG